LEALATEDVGLFSGHLVNFKSIWYILWSFGIFSPVLVCCIKKNLATPTRIRLPTTSNLNENRFMQTAKKRAKNELAINHPFQIFVECKVKRSEQTVQKSGVFHENFLFCMYLCNMALKIWGRFNGFNLPIKY
jgi:hypothetical protein